MSQQQTIWRPFLLFRSTIFALLTWFNVIAFGFGIWDIVELKNAGVSAFGPPIFVIFNSCASLLLLFAAIAELFIRGAKTAQVSFECGWTFIMAVLYFAAAVDVTVMGPPQFCSNQALVNVCAASAVVVIATWLSAVTMMLYFLSLYMAAISHYWVYGGVWSTTVYSVPWFSKCDVTADFRIEASPPLKVFHDIETPVHKSKAEEDYCDALVLSPTPTTPESLFNFSNYDAPRTIKVIPLVRVPSKESFCPTWAKSVKMRRGIDQPFVLPGAKHLSRMIKACMPDVSPTVPPKAKVSDLPKLELDLTPRYPSYGHFPEKVRDEDKPVTFQRLSQWIRADGASAVSKPS